MVNQRGYVGPYALATVFFFIFSALGLFIFFTFVVPILSDAPSRSFEAAAATTTVYSISSTSTLGAEVVANASSSLEMATTTSNRVGYFVLRKLDMGKRPYAIDIALSPDVPTSTPKVSLTGWKLQSTVTGYTYELPDTVGTMMTFAGVPHSSTTAEIVVYPSTGFAHITVYQDGNPNDNYIRQTEVTDYGLFIGALASVWRPKDTVVLLDEKGAVITTLTL